jgi:ATP-binding cassette, subfamily B, bacterial
MDLELVTPPLRHILVRYLKTARLILFLVTLLTIAGALTGVAAPYLFSRLIDLIEAPSVTSGLMWAFLGYAALMGISFALQRISAFLTFMTSESLNFVTSTAFFERLVTKAPAFYLEHNPAEIQSAQNRGTESLNIVVQFALAAILPGAAQLILSLVLLGTVLSIDIVVIVVVYGLAYIALIAYSAKITRKHLDAAVEASQESAKFIGNAIGGMDTLRQFGSDRWMIGQFSTRQRTALKSWHRYATIQVRFAVLFGLALSAQFAITLWLLVPRVATGELTVGDIVLFNTLLLQLNLPFQMLGQAIQQIAQSYAKFLPFARMWAAQTHGDGEAQTDIALTDGVVRFNDVGFTYANGRGVDGAGFTAQRGAITYITGDTGAGKSTLFKLLLKSMPPQSGQILVDGTDLELISRASWFAQIAAVPQDIVLLNDTLATNIVLGRPYDDARLRRAAERAAIADFIDGLEEGFATIVGERGLKLSGGERQRIAIARALYADPAIVLLDEASSALDAETEKDIMDQLRQISDQVTIIAITHRLSVIAPHDNVVRIGPPSSD